jgi:hypothetical protein
MAASVWAKIGDPDDVWGRHRVTFWTLTLSATAYVAGGFAVTGNTFGVKAILGIELVNVNPPLSTTTSIVPQYNANTGFLQFFGTGTATTNALNEFVSASMTGVFTFRITSVSD